MSRLEGTIDRSQAAVRSLPAAIGIRIIAILMVALVAKVPLLVYFDVHVLEIELALTLAIVALAAVDDPEALIELAD